MMDKDTERDVTRLIFGCLCLMLVHRLWTLRIRPFLAQYVGVLHDDAGAPALRLFGLRLSSVDLIATAVLGVCLYVLARVVWARVNGAGRPRAADREQDCSDDIVRSH